MARTFNPAQHPRDRFGRFTKSRTVKASAKDKKAAREVAEGFQPRQIPTAERQIYLKGLAGSQPDGAFADVLEANKALRAGKDSEAADRVDAAMTALPDDVLLSRQVPLSAFGATDPMSLHGMKVRDAGFAPAQLGTVQPADGQVRMHVATPAGTRAAVNPDTGEVILDRDTEMVVAKVAKNSAGGHDMWLTVLPKTDAEQHGSAEPVDGDAKVRADLMKLKTPELRSQMRERGLKPGRMRKSQMVDALVADETGDDAAPARDDVDDPAVDAPAALDPGAAVPTDTRPQRQPEPADDLPYDDRVAAAAKDKKALDAAPLSLLPRSREQLAAMPRTATLLKAYRMGEAGHVSAALRDGGEASPATGKDIADFDAGMSASKLTGDAVFYQAAPTAWDVFGEQARGDLTGFEWNDPDFRSVTARRQTAVDQSGGRGLLMRVLAPAGTGAVTLSSGHTSEVLLDRKHTYRVVKDHGRDKAGLRLVDVEMVPKTGDEPDRFHVVQAAETTADSPLSPEKIAALPDTALGRGLASGIKDAKTLSGGAVGDVRLVTFNDGSQAVQKIAHRTFAGRTAKDLTDSEELAGQVGKAIGAPVPEVIRTNDHEVFMEYVAGAKPGANALNRAYLQNRRDEAFNEFINSRDGRLLGVLDLVSGNNDRHAENWLVRKDGRIVGIDHGLVWSDRQVSADVTTSRPTFDSPFAGRFFTSGEWQPNDLSAADIAWMRTQIEQLRSSFEAQGRGGWLAYTLARLDQLGAHAQGTDDRIRP